MLEEFHYDLNNATFINEDLFEEAINLEKAGIYPRALQTLYEQYETSIEELWKYVVFLEQYVNLFNFIFQEMENLRYSFVKTL